MDMIVAFEGLKLKAYLDSANIPTIGVGTIRYPSGIRVKMGETCTPEQAYTWLKLHLSGNCKDVDDLTIDSINQNQFDAIVSFVYNCGIPAYKGSTLRKLINKNPKDPAITAEFLKWNKAGGKVVKGLTNRRKAEAKLYFS